MARDFPGAGRVTAPRAGYLSGTTFFTA